MKKMKSFHEFMDFLKENHYPHIIHMNPKDFMWLWNHVKDTNHYVDDGGEYIKLINGHVEIRPIPPTARPRTAVLNVQDEELFDVS